MLAPQDHPKSRVQGGLQTRPAQELGSCLASYLRQPPPRLDERSRPMPCRGAWPNRLYVSSTRLAPHNGLLSRAARKGRGPNAPVAAATSMVRSISRRSIWVSISRLRKFTSVPEALGWLATVQAVQNQLPASIHGQRFNDFVVGNTDIRLQDGCQRQLRGRDGRLPEWTVLVEHCQFPLKGLVKEFMPVLPEEYKKFGPPDPLENRLLGCRWFHGGLPG